MSALQTIFLTIFFIISLTFIMGISYFYAKTKREMLILEDAPVLVNLDRKGSHILGLVIKEDTGRMGRIRLIYKKKGVDYTIISNNLIKITDNLDDRKLYINFPKYSEDLNSNIKYSYLAEPLSKYIEDKSLEDSVIKALREARDRQDIIRILQGGGELSNKFIRYLLEIANQMDKLENKDKSSKSLDN